MERKGHKLTTFFDFGAQMIPEVALESRPAPDLGKKDRMCCVVVCFQPFDSQSMLGQSQPGQGLLDLQKS